MVQRAARRGLDFVGAFYKAAHGSKSLVQDLDSLLFAKRDKVMVRALPFSTELPLDALFPLPRSKSRVITRQAAYDGVSLYTLERNFKSSGKVATERGRFFVYESPQYQNVYVAITIEPTSFYRKALSPVLQSLYPRVHLGFIPHGRLHRLLTEFREASGFSELVIRRASLRLRLSEGRWIVKMLSWPGTPLEEAFRWVEENDGWFQSVQFEARSQHGTSCRVSVTREGLVQTDYAFSKVFDSFVMPVCRIHHENRTLFSKRGRLENDRLAARPLAIDFESDQFRNVADNSKFIQAMRRLTTASVSVLHGNPHIHLSLIDYYDGSTFDLWVLSVQRIVLVPQMKATVAAIKRVVRHIFDTYAEGEVRDYQGGKP